MSDEQKPALVFTEAAARRVKTLIDEEENPNLSLRVFITGGGCSGFQYGFTFEEGVQPTDWVVLTALPEGGDVRLVVDPMSYGYLIDAEIDYREDVNGEQFVIRNPNAKTTCGCGSSFSVGETPSDDAQA
ncbi:MAG: iron-sulfur cluster insertion protein ErpA [Gammaproteobacteria bacterium RIFCSPHIGHO2_12_FULL_45_9]|nr:MAG: iron-sulfur cluster insertion protein ErpA [Gammaproteobacteria bacterium RIFCSPHIGHO2_12_FULL_45_9]